MSLFIPLGIFLAAILGIALLIMRKFPYLKKLTPEVLESDRDPRGFWGELFPEAAHRLRPVKLRQHRLSVISFFEKMVKAIKEFFKMIESRMKGLAESIKRKTEEETKIITRQLRVEKAKEEAAQREPELSGYDSMDDLKRFEQDLIIEVAKDPKNPTIYEKLADVYEKMGMKDEAVQSIEAAIKLSPDTETYQDKLQKLLGKTRG